MCSMTRREVIRAALCCGVALPALPRLVLAEWARSVRRGATDRPYLDAALRGEHWLRSVAIDTPRGRTWPALPGDARRGAPETDLYSGAPGVVLFYLELHHYTRERRYLDEAVRGALDLLPLIPTPGSAVHDAGFYSGLAGHVFVVDAVHRASGRDDLGAAAARGARALADGAAPTPDGGVAWNDVTDIIAGSAGIGLMLLQLRHLVGDRAIDVARRAGDHLLARAIPVGDGERRWMMDPTFPREMPNFSHGTAGVAYFLATLSRAGGESRHLEAATDGARYLEAIAERHAGTMLIRHHNGDGAELFYLGWCHGPVGTNRLWERLRRIDGGAHWGANEEAGARGIVASGVPERRTPGFWNNISQCCGNTGVAEYFLSRHQRRHDPSDLAYARRQADDALRRSTIIDDRQEWVQAENRVSPLDTAAQTGWMQGAAGVGAMLLRLDAAERGTTIPRAVVFPDSPWAA
jgi:lantibiotic modifying enzyme